ncbi:MAG: SpoIIIAH-like family protein [Christensenellaceae bacterium]
MTISNKKKIIVMSCLVALLAVTAAFNFILADREEAQQGAIATANYFMSYRSERTSSRSEELVQLDSVIAATEEGSDRYNEAVEMKMNIIRIMEDELRLETMIKSLGFADAVVSIGYDSDNVNVFINSAELEYDTALSIYHLLKEETAAVAGNIIIMPVYSES